jgi:hypothetical protein
MPHKKDDVIIQANKLTLEPFKKIKLVKPIAKNKKEK